MKVRPDLVGESCTETDIDGWWTGGLPKAEGGVDKVMVGGE